MGPDAMILVFWVLSFKSTFLLSSFTFIKRLFNSSSLSAIRVVCSTYLRLLIFLLAVLIPACASSSPVFLLMYSAYKLNKQGDNIQPWRTPFPFWSQSSVQGAYKQSWGTEYSVMSHVNNYSNEEEINILWDNCWLLWEEGSAELGLEGWSVFEEMEREKTMTKGINWSRRIESVWK